MPFIGCTGYGRNGSVKQFYGSLVIVNVIVLCFVELPFVVQVITTGCVSVFYKIVPVGFRVENRDIAIKMKRVTGTARNCDYAGERIIVHCRS